MNQVALPLLRAAMASAVAAVTPTQEIIDAAVSADRATDSIINFAADEIETQHTYKAVLAAIRVAHTGSSKDAFVSISKVGHAAGESAYRQGNYDYDGGTAAADAHAAAGKLSNSVIFSDADAIHRNGSKDVLSTALWPNADLPDFFRKPYAKLKDFWEADEETWGFWMRWYEGMLTGEPMDWALQEQIILSVQEETWEAGAGAVAKAIREIEARHLGKALAETIELTPSGRLSLVPNPFKETKQLGQLLDIVRDNVELATGDMSNGLTETGFVAQKIQRATTRYANDPQRLEMEFEDVKVAIATEIAEDVIPSSTANRALMQSVSDAAGSIRESDPEIAANRERLNRIRLSDISEDEGQQIADVAVQVADISDGVLRDDLLEDRFYLPGVRRDDDVPGPIVPLGGAQRNEALQAQAAQLRVASRLAKVWSYVQENPGKTFDRVAGLASIIGLILAFVL